MREELLAIIEKNSRIDLWCVFSINAVWTTSKDDSLRLHFFDFFEISFVGVNFTVNVALSDASCDQLIVLTSEIENYNLFVLHKFSSY